MNSVYLNSLNVENWHMFYSNRYVCHDHLQNDSREVLQYVRGQLKVSFDRLILYKTLFQTWLEKSVSGRKPIRSFILERKYNDIIIYGAGTIGKVVYEEIKELNIKINICDKNAHHVNWYDDDIISPEQLEAIPCQCILITPIHIYDTIVQNVKKNKKSNYFSVLDIITQKK